MQVNIQQSTFWKRWAGGVTSQLHTPWLVILVQFLISPNETQSPTHFTKKSHTHLTENSTQHDFLITTPIY